MKIKESYIARRGFLWSMLGGGAAALGASAAVPLTYYAGNLRDKPPPAFLAVPPAEYDLPPGKSKLLMLTLPAFLACLLIHSREVASSLLERPPPDGYSERLVSEEMRK